MVLNSIPNLLHSLPSFPVWRLGLVSYFSPAPGIKNLPSPTTSFLRVRPTIYTGGRTENYGNNIQSPK